mmetsp:Transcript_6428/g.18150  ORF Transcript_6428/g.18150 Transcript_6428/m.18150 type:complete len:146 (-) Transcript_6428:1698-2135(-)|eukprot:CAMPEP_0118861822 /NCGR_PEP_ID=MMETSP1163-20130328/7224_1 /TAXON_ID=124430 /ORGANISM="Phaeomonas parva, Strain CCMP2877" /LENGTH=145 /DNA_ID=CAMNT_0006795663 /DNA_START=110 /DNA_END=547 /DNA_ORIENTATION=+
MGARAEAVIPARFLLTIGNAIAFLMALYHTDDNVDATVGDAATDAEKDAAESEIQTAIAAGFLCCFVEIVGMGLGFTLFFPKMNFLQVCLHFLSGVYVSYYILDSWMSDILWRIVIFCNAPAVVMELAVWFAIFVLRIVPFARDD